MPGMGSASQPVLLMQLRPQVYSPPGAAPFALPSNQPTHERLTAPTRPGVRRSEDDSDRSASASPTAPFYTRFFSNANPAPLIQSSSTTADHRLLHPQPPPAPFRPPTRSDVNISNRPVHTHPAPMPPYLQYPPTDRSQQLYGGPSSEPNTNRFATQTYGWEQYTNGGATGLNPSYTESVNRPNAKKVSIPFVNDIASDSVIALGNDCQDGARSATIWAKWIGDEWQLSEFACRSLRT